MPSSIEVCRKAIASARPARMVARPACSASATMCATRAVAFSRGTRTTRGAGSVETRWAPSAAIRAEWSASATRVCATLAEAPCMRPTEIAAARWAVVGGVAKALGVGSATSRSLARMARPTATRARLVPLACPLDRTGVTSVGGSFTIDMACLPLAGLPAA
jgi:hypothetical protein